jgi:hypothetical protein
MAGSRRLVATSLCALCSLAGSTRGHSAQRSAARRALPFAWPGWEHIATSTWGSNSSCCASSRFEDLACCSGLDSPAEVRYKTQFDLVFLDSGIGTPGCRFAFDNGTDTMLDCHRHRSQGAALVKAVAPSKPVFTYRQISLVLEGNDPAAPELQPLWLTKDDKGNAIAPGRLDWRKPAAVQWYTDNVIGVHTAADPHFDGVFVDGPLASSQMCCDANLTLATKKQLFLGLGSMLKAVSRLLASHGKVLTVSLGSHFSSLTPEFYADGTPPQICAADAPPSSMEPCCAFGEEKFAEIVGPFQTNVSMYTPFRQFNIPSRDFGDAAHGGNDTLGCAAAVMDAAEEMRRRPAFYCNNDGWPNRTDGGVGLARHTISMAAYLMGAAEGSYFSSGLHWSDLIPGTDEKAWPFWPDFEKKLGKPLGPMVVRSRDHPMVFTREFEVRRPLRPFRRPFWLRFTCVTSILAKKH